MNEDTNKELEQNINTNVIDANTNVIDTNNDATTSNINETGVVEEVSFDYKDEVVQEEKKEEVEVANTVIDEVSSVDKVTTLEEVSVSSDASSLDVTEVSENSVFNEKQETDDISGGMKEGLEKAKTQKKGFPYGMVIVVVLVIIFVFSMDFIAEFIEKSIVNKENEIIEEKEKSDSSDMDDSEKDKDKVNQKEEHNDKLNIEDNSNNNGQ